MAHWCHMTHRNRGILLSIGETVDYWCPMTLRNRGILLSIGENVDCTQRQHGSLVSHDSQAQGKTAEYWRDSMAHWCPMTHRNRDILLSIGETVDCTETAWLIGVP